MRIFESGPLAILNGGKSFLAGLGLVLVGAAGITLSFVSPDSEFAMLPQEAMETVCAGLAIWGLAHKLEKGSEK
jgi:hypothetical protein